MSDGTPASTSELLPGTLEMLILRTLTLGSLHGYGIAQHIEQHSRGVLKVEQGSLYPALERLLRRGWALADWTRSPTGRRARYYTITAAGQAHLEHKTADYDRVIAAVERIMTTG